jgi:hypothetical protein
VEVLDLYRKKTEEAGTELGTFRDRIADSYAFTSLGAAQLALTVENQFKSVKNTLSTTFVEAFDAIQPQLLVFSSRLKEIFAKDEFKMGIQAIAIALADLAIWLADNTDKIVGFVTALLAFKAAMFVIEGIKSLSLAFVALTEGLAAARLGAIAFQASLGIIGVVLLAAGAAWAYYNSQKESQSAEKQRAALTTLGEYSKALTTEAERIEEVNRQMLTGKSRREAEAGATEQQALALAQLNKQKAIEAAQTTLRDASGKLDKANAYGTGGLASRDAQKSVDAAKANLASVMQLADKELATVEIAIQRNRAAARAQAVIQEAQAESARARALEGAGSGELIAKGSKAAENALKNETTALLKTAAGYKARYDALVAGEAQGQHVMADTNVARVQAEIAEGKYGKVLNETTRNKLMSAAAEADQAKYLYDREVALNDLTLSLQRKKEVEVAGLAEANAGHVKFTSTVEAETAALLKQWGVEAGSDRYNRLMAEAKAIGEVTAAKEIAAKFNKGTDNMTTEARGLIEAGDAVMEYGRKGKQTAVQLAELQIAQQGLDASTQSGIINARKSAAELHDLGTAYKELGKVASDLFTSNEKDEAESVAALLTSEAAKVQAKRAATMKVIELYTQQAQAAYNAALVEGRVTAEVQEAFEKAMAARGKALSELDRQTQSGMSRALVKDMQTLVEESKELGSIMESTFGRAGGAIGGMVTAMAQLVKSQAEYAEGLRIAAALREKGDSAGALRAEAQAQANYSRAQVKSYADLAGASKNFFKEGTTGYKILATAEKAFRAMEMALAYESMIRKIFFTEATTAAVVTGNAVQATSAVTGAATEVGAKMMVANANAVAAVANQGNGDPYTAFFRIGAMIAIMAALGLAVGGGGASSAPPISEQRQKTQGTGTVLGDEAAKSESLSKSLELLVKNSDIGLTYSSNMLLALRNIEAGISGMATAVARSPLLRGTPTDQKALGVGSSRGFLGFSSSSTTLTDSGIQFFAQSIKEIMTQGISAMSYAVTHTDSSSWFGLSKSSSDKTTTGALAGDLKSQMQLTVRSIYDAIIEAGKVFGKDMGVMKSTLDSLNTNGILDKLSLKGLSGDEIAKQLEAVFGELGDKMAEAVMPGLGQFQKVGEGYFQTLVRVANGIDVATMKLQGLNIAMVAYTDVANKQGDVAAEIVRDSIAKVEQIVRPATEVEINAMTQSVRVITGQLVDFTGAVVTASTGIGEIIQTMDGSADDIIAVYKALVHARDLMNAAGLNGDGLNRSQVRGAGSLDNLTSGLDSYYKNFFNETERQQIELELVRKQFERLNLTMPGTREGFRQMVEAADALGTEAGDELVGKLMSVADAFAEVSHSLEPTSEIMQRLMSAMGDSAGLLALQRQKELAAATTDAEKAILNYIYGLEDEKSALQDASGTRAIQIEILKAQGHAEEALALQRQAELAGLSEASRVLKIQLYNLQDVAAATALLNKGLGMQAEALKLTGDTAGAAAIQRQIELAGMDESLRPLQLRVYALQDEATATANANKALTMYADILRLQGDDAGATAIQRQLELAAMDESLRPLKQRLYLLQDEATAVANLNKGLSLQAQILELEGHSAASLQLKREMELSSMDASLRPLQERINALQDEAAAMDLLKTASGMMAQALRLAGDEAGALALERQNELSSMDASLVPIQNYIYALQDQATAAQKAQERIQKLNDALADAQSHAQNALDALKKSVDAQKTLLDKQYDADVDAAKKRAEAAIDTQKALLGPAEDALKAVQNIFDAIQQAIKSTEVESAALNRQRRREAEDTIRRATAASNTGGSLVGFAGLDKALEDIQKPSEDFFGSFEDYARDQARIRLELEQLGGNAKNQVDKAQLTIDAINATIEAIQAASDAELAALKQQHDDSIAALDLIVSNAQAQLDALNGISDVPLSIEQASANFQAALADVRSAQQAVATAQTQAANEADHWRQIVAAAATAATEAYTAIQDAAAIAGTAADATVTAADAALTALQTAASVATDAANSGTSAVDAANALATALEAQATAQTNALNTVAGAITALTHLMQQVTNAGNGDFGTGGGGSMTTTEAAITAFYQQFLGRAPDSAGMAFYKDQVENRGYTLEQVANEIEHSPEYANRTIRSLFQNLLGRAPDASGLSFYTDQIVNKGFTAAQVQAEIQASPEYLAMHPDGSHAHGLPYVPHDGYIAMLHQGERVLTASQNKFYGQPGGPSGREDEGGMPHILPANGGVDFAALANRLRDPGDSAQARADLAAAINELKQTIRDGDVANVQKAKDLYNLFRRWDTDGMPPERGT